MANNRMCLRCVPCNETFLLAKYYPTLTNGWFVPTGWPRTSDDVLHDRDEQRLAGIVDTYHRLDAFLEKHSFCNKSGGDWNFGNRDFDLTFEVPKEPSDAIRPSAIPPI